LCVSCQGSKALSYTSELVGRWKEAYEAYRQGLKIEPDSKFLKESMEKTVYVPPAAPAVCVFGSISAECFAIFQQKASLHVSRPIMNVTVTVIENDCVPISE
jgi:hypothetical protein